ncbi:hypothetical protein CKM354_000717400 [Cercospora kikuchii]|uniref:Uncharacterized protein n=1 Tax=Cercospora kikuchii TaxID=84275 RepID=A0A9P3FIY6_9PEZI|nr:uncharacterized protein CKM354_000717400 [Cercospora kikuchii]GIZ43965.1 hypothetical protein CKM354_000717400 [Cercospora kikuchii]
MTEQLLSRDFSPTKQRSGRPRHSKAKTDGVRISYTNQPSMLLSLPGDIRNIIWDYVFQRADGLHVDLSVDRKRRHDYRSIFALSMTCRHLYNETRGLPLWLNVVHLHVPVLQDLSVLCSHRYQDSAPSMQPPTSRRIIEAPFCGDLASKHVALRNKAQEYVTLAMRLPHVDMITTRLWTMLSKPHILRSLRKVHVHLGFQTNNVFLERFYTAWEEVLPYLLLLRNYTELRVSFQLRLSRRLVVHYDFRTDDAEMMLSDVDRCVLREGDLTLPEMASVNAIKWRIRRGLFDMTTPRSHLPRPQVKKSSATVPCWTSREVVKVGALRNRSS